LRLLQRILVKSTKVKSTKTIERNP